MILVSTPRDTPRRIPRITLTLVLGCGLFAGCASTPRNDVSTVGSRPAPVTTPRAPAPPTRPPIPDTFPVRLLYLQTTDSQELIAKKELVVTAPGLGLKRLPPGTWRVSAQASAPAQIVHPVYVKAFEHDETEALNEAMRHWQREGYTPTVTTLGRSITGSDGTLHDNRLYWLAIRRCNSKSEAETLKARLQQEKVWAWLREEVARPAEAVVTLTSTLGESVLRGRAPMTFRSEAPLALPDARRGKAPLEVPGPVDAAIDQTGNLAITGELAMDEYLRGILPAEMYPDWPIEALKSQAVAARSEIIVHANGKHFFDGYDFCIEQHCRAFGGRAGHVASTDRAVAETLGEVLVNADNSIVPTVFSSNCGGWTENNENVWDGGADAALRGRADSNKGDNGEHLGNMERWLNSNPPANCGGDSEYYRWTREISLAKLSAQFNREYGIGALKAIEPLERGVSGRIKSLRLTGDRKSAVIEKELNVRRAFENLPSALCTFTIQKGVVRVHGAGFGHGVGLCQHGANGMAKAGRTYNEILQHYFSGAHIAQL